jgi:hypothetical protein
MWTVNACERQALCIGAGMMHDGGISASLERSGQALDRIERALADRRGDTPRDEALRAKVREALIELDALIGEASR